jgi:2-oxoglutarate ferredoxin oxidoreductase subunit alpha
MQAFNLAEKYQTPVVLLTDKHILESHQSIKPFTYDDYQIDRGRLTFEPVEDYHRYAATADGISLRTVAGSGNFFVANSDEHDQDGYSSESSEDRITQMNKRMQKLVTCEQQDMAGPQRFGPEQADITIVSWGSNKGAILRALEEFNNVNYIHLTWMNPFPHFQLRDMLLQAKYILNIEANYSAQLAGLIKEKTGIDILAHLLKYDGRPIYPEEIVQTVQDILNSS